MTDTELKCLISHWQYMKPTVPNYVFLSDISHRPPANEIVRPEESEDSRTRPR
jgi:hypothetical protein